jgi:anti-sigma factor RsiW
MSRCESVGQELVAFHFGEVTDEARAEVEAHLVVCPECLRRFLSLKRGLETDEGQPAPSPSFRARLRGAVAHELGLGPPRWRWWERPLALGVAGAVVVLATLLVQAAVSNSLQPPRDTSVLLDGSR